MAWCISDPLARGRTQCAPAAQAQNGRRPGIRRATRLPSGTTRRRSSPSTYWTLGRLHGLIPVLGALAFIPAFLPKPLSYAGPAAAVWMVIGVVYLVVLMVKRPERIRETKRVFAEE